MELTTFRAKRAMEVFPFYRIRGIENWKPNHWFSLYFDHCGFVKGYVFNNRMYG